MLKEAYNNKICKRRRNVNHVGLKLKTWTSRYTTILPTMFYNIAFSIVNFSVLIVHVYHRSQVVSLYMNMQYWVRVGFDAIWGSDVCCTLNVMEPISVIRRVDCIQALPISNVCVEVIHIHLVPILPISVYSRLFISFDTTCLTNPVVL